MGDILHDLLGISQQAKSDLGAISSKTKSIASFFSDAFESIKKNKSALEAIKANNATNSRRSCGSGVLVCWARAGSAKPMANPARARSKRLFIACFWGFRVMRRRGTCGRTARVAGARERTAFGQWSRGETRKKLDETYNHNDAVAANFTQDAVLVTPCGPIFGRPDIKQWYAELFKTVHLSNLLSTVDEDSPHLISTERNALWATGKWGTSGQGHTGGSAEAKGYWSAICTREGEDWKLRMLNSHFTIEPVATGAITPSPTATPSTQ
jgi:ketosteroid isomerase-like protein